MSGVSLNGGITAIDYSTITADNVVSGTLPNAVQDNITRLGTLVSGTWSATTIAVNKGGTGQTSYTNGQLLIGNTTGNTLAKASLTAGTDFKITNGAGTITLDNYAKTVKVLAKKLGANLNSTADQAFTMTENITAGIVTAIIITNVSTDLSGLLTAGGIYDGAGKPATVHIWVAAATLYTALTSATKYLTLSLVASCTALTDIITSSSTPTLSLTVAAGSAATADIYILGYDLA